MRQVSSVVVLSHEISRDFSRDISGSANRKDGRRVASASNNISRFLLRILSPVDTEATSAENASAGTAVSDQSAASSAANSGVVIETRNLSKIYRDFWGRKKVNALKSLDIEVKQGEIFGLLGPNGSGKSTTIKLILGLLFPTSGRVLVFDKDASETRKNERIGYLPEESYLYKFLSAEETLDFYGRLFDMSAADRKKRVEELIKLVGLSGARHRQLKEYSKGMTRRVGSGSSVDQRP